MGFGTSVRRHVYSGTERGLEHALRRRSKRNDAGGKITSLNLARQAPQLTKTRGLRAVAYQAAENITQVASYPGLALSTSLECAAIACLGSLLSFRRLLRSTWAT